MEFGLSYDRSGVEFGLSYDRSGVEFGLSRDRSGVEFGLSCDRSGVEFGLSCDRSGLSCDRYEYTQWSCRSGCAVFSSQKNLVFRLTALFKFSFVSKVFSVDRNI